MESKFYQTTSELEPGHGFTILGTIKKLYSVRDVLEPNRIKIESKKVSTCFHCNKKIFEGDWIKWANGSNETLHLDCEAQYEKDHGQTREFCKVRDAIFSDVTGKIILTLWKKDTDRFSVGDKIMVENGYVYNFQKELHISAGYYGTLSQIQKTRGRNYHEEQKQRQRAQQEKQQREQQEKQQREQQEKQQREQQEKQQREPQTSKIDDADVIEAYAFFQLNHNATFEQIKSKHREFILKYHPDKNKSANANAETIKINRAYDNIKKWWENNYD